MAEIVNMVKKLVLRFAHHAGKRNKSITFGWERWFFGYLHFPYSKRRKINNKLKTHLQDHYRKKVTVCFLAFCAKYRIYVRFVPLRVRQASGNAL